MKFECAIRHRHSLSHHNGINKQGRRKSKGSPVKPSAPAAKLLVKQLAEHKATSPALSNEAGFIPVVPLRERPVSGHVKTMVEYFSKNEGQENPSSFIKRRRPMRRPRDLNIAPQKRFERNKENYEKMRPCMVERQEFRSAISKLAAMDSTADIDVEACLESTDRLILELIENVASIRRNPHISENLKEYICKYIELSVCYLQNMIRPTMQGLTPGLVDIFAFEDERLALEKIFDEQFGDERNLSRQNDEAVLDDKGEVAAMIPVNDSENDIADEQLSSQSYEQYFSYRMPVCKALSESMQVGLSVPLYWKRSLINA